MRVGRVVSVVAGAARAVVDFGGFQSPPLQVGQLGAGAIQFWWMKADTGLPMMIVDGLGWVWKRWAILRVEERKSYFLRDGASRKIEFSMAL